MYVCVCLAVTESEVRTAIEGGAHDREAVTRACKAGGDCGACHGMIETMVEDHLETAYPRPDRSGCPPEVVSTEQLIRANRTRAA